ncbi:MAG: VOC family protein [Burkholderiales bacterium]|nr:VOC family protein [Burkholderiales bacterium]
MSRIRPAKFVHVVYRTRRFEQMLRWYQTVFDAKVQHQNPALAFLTYDDEHHRFAFANLDILQPGGTEADRRGLIGVDHVAYTYASLNDLLENYAQLKAQGIRPYWCIHHGITVSMYYADPDGNQMEFQVDSYGSTEEANAFMGSPHFAANPIGVEYDPEDWLARLRVGAPASEFLLRQTDEPISPIRGSFSNYQ